MLQRAFEALRYTLVQTSHLSQVWAWKALVEDDAPWGKRHTYAQPRPGTCFPVLTGRQRGLDAVEAMDDRRGVVEA
eukprot:3675873-Lingulodinium_polyedra.AAC.1